MQRHILLALLCSGLMSHACAPDSAQLPEPPSVITTLVTEQTVPVVSEWVGETVGSVTTEVRARVEGIVEQVVYTEGSRVVVGQVLYRIDPAIYVARQNQSMAELAKAESELARARADVERYKPLVEARALAREEYDNALAVQRAAEASVQAAKAVVQSRALEVDYATVRAPISGVAGRSQVQRGALVGRGDNTLLTTISAIHPMRVRFTMSEQQLLEFRRRHVDSDARSLTLQLVLSDGVVYEHPGRLLLADNAVDAATGTLLLEAEFPNPQGFLQPGLFARIRARTQRIDRAVVLPQRALAELQGQARVVVVSDSNVVSYRTVTVGARIGSATIITSGLQSGERVVIEGLQRIREGLQVAPTDSTLSIDTLLGHP